MYLREQLVLRIVHPGTLDGLPDAVLIGLALGIALKDVIACAIYAAPR